VAWRWLLLLVICCSLTSPVAAGDPAKLDLKRRVSCVLVRYYVAKYTVAAAEAYARGKGASEAQIEAARHCLPPTLTAQSPS
jgi:hypothetical protein